MNEEKLIENYSFKIPELLIERKENIAILIRKIGENQLHCGIIHKNEEDYEFLHLAWHNFLSNDKLNVNEEKFKEAYYTISSIPKLRQLSIAAFCRLVYSRDKEQDIPYGLKYEGSPFNDEGIINLNKNSCGLTCATFVLAIFEVTGVNLIDYSKWPIRDEDKIWHKHIIKSLEFTKDKYKNVTQTHINNVKSEVGCSRFRPEEVAISLCFEITPEDSQNIINAGKVLKSKIA